MRCLLCQNLSVKTLVDLAETEFSSCRVPAKAFFRHHPSIEALEASANSGCDLCQLIQRGLEETMVAEPDSDSDSNTFRPSKKRTVLDHARALVNRLDFRIWISTDHVDGATPFSDVEMLESLEVLPGWNPAFEDGSPLSDSEEEPLRAIKFMLTTPPGRYVPIRRHYSQHANATAR
jgi:hypothetical protein